MDHPLTDKLQVGTQLLVRPLDHPDVCLDDGEEDLDHLDEEYVIIDYRAARDKNHRINLSTTTLILEIATIDKYMATLTNNINLEIISKLSISELANELEQHSMIIINELDEGIYTKPK